MEKVRESDLRRLEAIQRQNGQCLYCGRTITFRTCEMDHIVPRKGVGSTNTRTNFAAVCAECNRMKSNTPFAIWARSEDAQTRGVSLAEAKKRVTMLLSIPSHMLLGSEAFKQAVIARLQQTEMMLPSIIVPSNQWLGWLMNSTAVSIGISMRSSM